MGNAPFENAIKLAVLSGLRSALGPAFVTSAQRRPTAGTWVAVAVGEMVLEKVGVFPRRANVLSLIPHAVSGAWVARESLRAEGIDDPWAAPIGAAVAAGVSTLAPMIRTSARRLLGVSQPVMSLAEDYLAVRLGADAIGIPMESVVTRTMESLEEVKDRLVPALLQSAGAGSM